MIPTTTTKQGIGLGSYASGTITDAQEYHDGSNDRTWNGVWEAKTNIHEAGWSVEYKIPYHVLRFTPKDSNEEYLWGMQFQRNISRRKEHDQWVLVRQGESGWISHYGHIEGIKGIQPPHHIEFLPYIRTRSLFESKSANISNKLDGHQLTGALGGDLRYGITSNLSLNAAINPDFGQVEADPAVLNLTVFETFFEERRPFFIEGSTLFKTPSVDIVGIESSPFQLFYSRRIGKQPGLFGMPAKNAIIDRPDATTILGAAKLSGKTTRKTSFNIIEAVTANEYALVETKTSDPVTGLERAERSEHRIEPLTNFFTGRVQQDIKTNSTLGAMLTTVNRDEASPAYAGQIDAHLKWRQNSYALYTRLAGSQTGTADQRQSGYAAQVYMYKFSGWLGGQLYGDAVSRDFNVNDLGFMLRDNILRAGAHVYANRQTPWLLARRSGFNLGLWSKWNYDGVNLHKGINVNNWNDLKNYWVVRWGLSKEFEALHDLETRGGPLMVRPGGIRGRFSLVTDWSKPLMAFMWVIFARWERNAGSHHQIGLGFTLRPASNIELQVMPSYASEFNFAQWVRNIDDNGDGKADHYVFGELKSRTLDFTTRANISFTPNLSFQAYIQPFVAVGDYGQIKELAFPESYEFTPYNKFNFNPDFSRRSLRGNMVLRWEYSPGSTLFIVWSQNRSDSFDDPSFRPFDSLRSSFSDEGQNIFLVKLNYWLGI